MSDDIVREFLVESSENLDLLDRELIKLEKDPGNRETLSSIFRTIHTIKGTCGFLGFSKLESVAHAGENLLTLLRDGAIALTAERTTALLALVDATREMLDRIDQTGAEGERDDAVLIAQLNRLQKDENGKSSNPAAANNATANQGPTIEKEPEKPQAQPDSDESDRVKLLGKLLIEQGVATPQQVATAIQKQLEGDQRALGEILTHDGVTAQHDVNAAIDMQQSARTQDSSIRVDVALLDRLMNRVGELVLLRNQIVQFANSTDDGELLGTSQRLNLITTELQESVMKTRMQPIGNIWNKFPRTVRDVALSFGKEVRIEMEGRDTELDKTIIEAINPRMLETKLLGFFAEANAAAHKKASV